MIKNKIKTQSGFTIIEIAIVMIVGGSLLAFLGSSLLDFQQKKKVALTEYRLERIKNGISVYLTKKHKLPCPASMLVAPGTIDFGRERGRSGTPASPPVSPDCRGAGPTFAGTRRVAGFSSANAVRYGSVPVRDLDLADDMIVDGWGNRFTYAVTIVQATINPPVSYTLNGGDIDIVGVDGVTSVLFPAGSAHYVVMSHGADGQGARDANGNNIPKRCINNVANIQRENCINQPGVDNDATFMDTMHRDDGSYDDFIIYTAEDIQNEDVPAGAVVPFNLQSCPPGWAAVEDARGRFVMGIVDSTLTVANQNVNRIIYDPFVIELSPATLPIDYPTGQTDVTDPQTSVNRARYMVPPYVALLYCVKN